MLNCSIANITSITNCTNAENIINICKNISRTCKLFEECINNKSNNNTICNEKDAYEVNSLFVILAFLPIIVLVYLTILNAIMFRITKKPICLNFDDLCGKLSIAKCISFILGGWIFYVVGCVVCCPWYSVLLCKKRYKMFKNCNNNNNNNQENTVRTENRNRSQPLRFPIPLPDTLVDDNSEIIIDEEAIRYQHSPVYRQTMGNTIFWSTMIPIIISMQLPDYDNLDSGDILPRYEENKLPEYDDNGLPMYNEIIV
jgi:hypothetical protein